MYKYTDTHTYVHTYNGVLLSNKKKNKIGRCPVVQQVKDPALSLLWLRSLAWHGFNLQPRNFHMPWAWPKKN